MIDATLLSDRLSRTSPRRALRTALAAAGLALLAGCAAQQEPPKETAPPEESPQAAEPSQVVPPAEETAEPAQDETREDFDLKPPADGGPAHRVGLLLPLSGPRAELGESLLRAAQLALFDVADEHFQLVVRDTKGTPDGAAAAAESAIGAGANLLMGPVFSSSVDAVAPVAQGGQVPVVAFSNDRTVARPGVYVTGLLPGEQVDRIVGYAAERGKTDFAVLVPNDAYGDRVAEAMRSAVRKHGVHLAKAQIFAPDARDIAEPVKRLSDYERRRRELESRRQELRNTGGAEARRELGKLKNLDALGKAPFDAVLLPLGGNRLRALAPTLPYYDVDPDEVQFLGTAQWNDPSLASEPTLRGGWFPAPPPGPWKRFSERYREAYGSTPAPVAGLAYDATALSALLARKAVRNDTPPAQVYTTEGLTQRSGFAGVNGLFRLDPDGLIERRYAVVEMQSNGLKVLDAAPSSFGGPTN